ncbi:hypothetical protein ACRRTK_015252 [Alexandromys fortis]
MQLRRTPWWGGASLVVDGKLRARRDQGQVHLQKRVPSDSLPLIKLPLSKFLPPFKLASLSGSQVFNTPGTYLIVKIKTAT